MRQNFRESQTVVGSDGRVSYDTVRGRSSVNSTQVGQGTITRSNSYFFSSRRPDDGARGAVITRDGAAVRPGGVGIVAGQVPVVGGTRRSGAVRTSPPWRGPTVEGFYGRDLDRRIVYPGVPTPRSASLRLSFYRRPAYVYGRTVVVGVPRPSCGFGFLTPVYDPYPVYPVPVYASSTFFPPPPVYVDNTYVDNSYHDYGPPPGYADAPYPYPADQAYAEAPPESLASPPPAPPVAPPPPVAEQPIDPQAQEPAPLTATPGEPAPQGGQSQPNLTREQQQMSEGLQAFAAGNYDQAGRIFLQVGMADNNNIDAWLAYAVARFATRDYEAAALAIRRGIRAMPEVVNSPIDIRERYGRKGDFDQQLAALEERVRSRPESGDAWLVLGFVRHFSGQREMAARTFDVVQRRFETDQDLAKTFLEAKSLEEIQRELAPNGQSGDGQAPPAGEYQGGYEPGASHAVDSIIQAEQNLRDAGLVGPGTQ